MTPRTSSRPSSRATTQTGTTSRSARATRVADDVEPVGGRVEQGAQAAALVQPRASLPSSQSVNPDDHEDDDRPAVGLRAQQQPQEQRDAEQPQHREGVRQGPDAVGQVLAVDHRRRSATGSPGAGRGRAADGPFDDVTAPPAPAHRARG